MLTNLKRNLGLLLAVATLSAVTALVPVTAGAAASVIPTAGSLTDPNQAPVNTASYSACPGSSAAAAGFTDTTSTDVDCIKMFGITQGATATTYEPAGTIPRWQMALFLSRMYTSTSLAAGTGTFTAFTDISGYSAEIQTAINAIAASGITVGTATGVFSPADNVTREQMALFLYRMGQITKPYNSAVLTTRGLWNDVYATDVATGQYNYGDIASTSFEATEAIASLYNAGVTGETCTSLSVTTCSRTYRPTDDTTRAEMATMVTAMLGHTNARPAGVSIQSPDSLATVGTKTTSISVRNADFTPASNTLVDEFYQGHLDGTTAVPIAAQTPFTTLGTCVVASLTTTAGTLCTLDAGDKATNALGNVAGTSQTAASNKTLNWWVWTGTTGSAYVDGVSTVYKLSAPLGTAAAATEYASAASTMTISGTGTLGYALGTTGSAATGDFQAYNAALTGNDGVLTRAGLSRTITVQMKGTYYALGALVVDGYTLKFADKKVDMLGNVNTTNTYVASSGGTASYTVTCGADNNAAATSTGIGNAVGSNGLGSYWESHEVTITEATALGTAAGVSRPASAGAVTFAYSGSGQHNDTMNISCDDAVSTHAAATTSASLTTSANNYATATAGSMMSITATAFDQYGVGMAGQITHFKSATDLAGAADRATLTTGVNGTATLTAVVCTAGIETVAWSTAAGTVSGTAATMVAQNATAPSKASNGTTTYCTTPVNQDGVYQAVSSVDEVTTITPDQADTTTGTSTFFICNEAQAGHQLNPSLTAGLTGAPLCVVTGTVAGAADMAAAMQVAFRAASNVDDATTVVAVGSGTSYTVTFPVNTGSWTIATGTNSLVDGTPTATAFGYTTTTTNGAALEEWLYVDNDATANTILVEVNTETTSIAGAAVAAAKSYHVITYDSTDVFMVDATDGAIATSISAATEAQFEATLAALDVLTTEISGTEREATTGSGVSIWTIGK